MEQKRSKQKLADEKLDEQFVNLLRKIQQRYLIFNRHIQIRIEKWVEKLLQCDENTHWRKSRNNYINLLFEMVTNQKINGIFLKMPPQKNLPHLSETQYRAVLQQLKIVPKPEHIKNDQITITKIQCPKGDNTGNVTPNCETYRTSKKNEQHLVDLPEKQQNIHNSINTKIKIENLQFNDNNNSHKNDDLIDKIALLVLKYQKRLVNDPQFLFLVQSLKQILSKKNKCQHEESSGQLKIEEGIAMNMVNLLQSGNLRGATQMQYFKAALL